MHLEKDTIGVEFLGMNFLIASLQLQVMDEVWRKVYVMVMVSLVDEGVMVLEEDMAMGAHIGRGVRQGQNDVPQPGNRNGNGRSWGLLVIGCSHPEGVMEYPVSFKVSIMVEGEDSMEVPALWEKMDEWEVHVLWTSSWSPKGANPFYRRVGRGCIRAVASSPKRRFPGSLL